MNKPPSNAIQVGISISEVQEDRVIKLHERTFKQALHHLAMCGRNMRMMQKKTTYGPKEQQAQEKQFDEMLTSTFQLIESLT